MRRLACLVIVVALLISGLAANAENGTSETVSAEQAVLSKDLPDGSRLVMTRRSVEVTPPASEPPSNGHRVSGPYKHDVFVVSVHRGGQTQGIWKHPAPMTDADSELGSSKYLDVWEVGYLDKTIYVLYREARQAKIDSFEFSDGRGWRATFSGVFGDGSYWDAKPVRMETENGGLKVTLWNRAEIETWMFRDQQLKRTSRALATEFKWPRRQVRSSYPVRQIVHSNGTFSTIGVDAVPFSLSLSLHSVALDKGDGVRRRDYLATGLTTYCHGANPLSWNIVDERLAFLSLFGPSVFCPNSALADIPLSLPDDTARSFLRWYPRYFEAPPAEFQRVTADPVSLAIYEAVSQQDKQHPTYFQMWVRTHDAADIFVLHKNTLVKWKLKPRADAGQSPWAKAWSHGTSLTGPFRVVPDKGTQYLLDARGKLYRTDDEGVAAIGHITNWPDTKDGKTSGLGILLYDATADVSRLLSFGHDRLEPMKIVFDGTASQHELLASQLPPDWRGPLVGLSRETWHDVLPEESQPEISPAQSLPSRVPKR